MQRHCKSAVVETLESRGYLSAVPACSLAAPTATATSEKVSANLVAKQPTLTSSKVTTPVDLTPHITGIVKRTHNGKTITIQIIVSNAGPGTAKGPLRVTVQFSYYLNGAYPLPFKVVTTPINIPAGKSKTVRITQAIPKSYKPFEYDMVVTLNGNKKIPETNYANNVANGAYFYLAP